MYATDTPPEHPSGDGGGKTRHQLGQFWGKRSRGCLLTQTIYWDLSGGDEVEWSLMIWVFNLVSSSTVFIIWGEGLPVRVFFLSYCLISLCLL